MAKADQETERGRALQAKRAWADAHASLSAADRKAPLGAGDLELLAATEYKLGRPDDDQGQPLSCRRIDHALVRPARRFRSPASRGPLL